MTKLLEVISVTDSEVSTTGGGGVVSPCDVATTGGTEKERDGKFESWLLAASDIRIGNTGQDALER